FMCFMYIFISITSSNHLTGIHNIISLIVFFSMVFTLQRGKMSLCLTLFSLGIIIHFFNDARGINLIEGVNQNLPLLAVLLLVPLLTIPLNREGIINAISDYLLSIQKNNKNSYNILSILLIILSPILNMGAIKVVHSISNHLSMSPKLLSKAYFSGFTPTVIWSPFFSSVGIVLYWLNMKYISYLAVGAVFALIQIGIGISLLNVTSIKNGNGNENNNYINKKNQLYKNKFWYLIIFVIGLILLLLIMEKLINKPILLLVCLICICVPVAWIIIRKQWFIIYEEYKKYKTNLLIGSKTEISLFLSAGIFGNALSESNLVKFVEIPLYWSANYSILTLFMFIITFVTLMAFLGVHQIIIIPLIIFLLNQSGVNYNPLSLAFICIFSWMFSAAISPLNVMNIVISESLNKNGFVTAFKWNGTYFFILLLAAFIYVLILNI